MYEDMTPEKIRGRILGRLKTDLQTREGSFTNDIIAAAAEEISEAYHSLDALIPAFYVDETSGPYIDKQEMFELYLSGRNMPEIAGDLGVNESTVSRSISRAKKRLRAETERAMTEARLRGDSARVDLLDPAALKAVMLALTPKQMVYFYLYYSEWLTLREIGELTGINHATICRTLRRALRNIGTLLGGQDTILENPEALDEVAYQVFCELDLHPELVPEGVRMPQAAAPRKLREQNGPSRIPAMADISVLVRGRYSRKKRKPPGKLLSALLMRREDPAKGSMFQWLEAVFAACWRKLKKCAG